MPSRVQMVQAVREASDAATARGSQLLAKYYEDHPELAPGSAEQAMNDFNMTRVAVAGEVSRVVRPVVQRYETQLARQQTTAALLRFLSPALLARDVLDELAGTGDPRHRHFMRQVDRFHQEWRDYFTPLIVKRMTVRDLDQIPSFRFEPEPPGPVAARLAIGFLGLVVPAAALTVFGWRRLRRYPITES
jgi:ABC-2 type transport system permease protein